MKLKDIIIEAIVAIGYPRELIEITTSKHSDYQTNIAFKLSKELGKSPIDIAEDINRLIPSNEIFVSSVSKPGFINFSFKIEFLEDTITAIFESDIPLAYQRYLHK